MSRRSGLPRPGSLAVVLCAGLLGLARAQEPEGLVLPVGTSAHGVTRKDAPATYRFDAPSAGVVTMLVQVEGPGDLVLFFCDEDGEPLLDLLNDAGQPFPGGRADVDLLGEGVEVLTLLVPWAGRYSAVVEVVGLPEAQFTISGAFAPAPGLARTPDPRAGRVRDAVTIPLGGAGPTQAETTLTPKEHDHRDWFSIRCDRAGKLRIVLRAADGDLRLDAFTPGQLRAPVASSDSDEQGVAGNESLTIDVPAGQVVLVRVGAVFAHADRISYRLITAITAD